LTATARIEDILDQNRSVIAKLMGRVADPLMDDLRRVDGAPRAALHKRAKG
jgi:hypothetical protein